MVGQRLFRVVFLCLAGLFAARECCAEAARKLEISDTVPSFSVVDIEGIEFNYPPADRTVLLVVFFSPGKNQSMKALSDIEDVLASFREMPDKLSFLAVSDDPNSVNILKTKNSKQLTVHFIKDNDFKLWGKFGVIASPTVFLLGTEGKVELIKAGYGYDFAPAIKSKLQTIMGLISEEDARDVSQVKTVTNTSPAEKANRHLKMAQMLESKGRYEAALDQLKMAIAIDPNAIEYSLELGRVYCLISEPAQAVDTVIDLSPVDTIHQAVRAFVLGKAYAQLKDPSNAEKYLLEAVDLDPKNGQAFYELGKVYESQNQPEKAMNYYRKSLDLVYNKK